MPDLDPDHWYARLLAAPDLEEMDKDWRLEPQTFKRLKLRKPGEVTEGERDAGGDER